MHATAIVDALLESQAVKARLLDVLMDELLDKVQSSPQPGSEEISLERGPWKLTFSMHGSSSGQDFESEYDEAIQEITDQKPPGNKSGYTKITGSAGALYIVWAPDIDRDNKKWLTKRAIGYYNDEWSYEDASVEVYFCGRFVSTEGGWTVASDSEGYYCADAVRSSIDDVYEHVGWDNLSPASLHPADRQCVMEAVTSGVLRTEMESGGADYQGWLNEALNAAVKVPECKEAVAGLIKAGARLSQEARQGLSKEMQAVVAAAMAETFESAL